MRYYKVPQNKLTDRIKITHMIIDKYEILIDSESCGERVDNAISLKLNNYSRSLIKKMILINNVEINGQKTKPDKRVKKGDVVSVVIESELKYDKIEPQELDLDFVEINKEFLVLNKRAGLVMHPAPGNMDYTVVNGLISKFPELKYLPRAGLVHRIDKNTTGLVLVARNQISYHKLVKKLSLKKIRREYLAVVNGIMISGGKIDKPLGRHKIHRKKMAIREDGKQAITHYRIKNKFRNHTYIDISLETGRTHQIRVHMASERHPIVGDRIYGWKPNFGKKSSERFKEVLGNFSRQALHAYKLTFTEPDGKNYYEFQCEPPEDFKQLVAEMEIDSADKNECY